MLSRNPLSLFVLLQATKDLGTTRAQSNWAAKESEDRHRAELAEVRRASAGGSEGTVQQLQVPRIRLCDCSVTMGVVLDGARGCSSGGRSCAS